MKLKKSISMIAAATLTLGLLSACASEDNSSETPKGKVIKIATQSPLSGGSATLGEAIKLGAQLALEEKQSTFEELGFSLELVPYDDQADPKKGVANADLIAADTSIVGIVGHLNSGVAIPASEVYEKNSLVMVSPANTATDVTDRGLKVVNRIVARDDFQGPAGAEFAVNTLKAKNIFVIQDKTAYGQGLADEFLKAAENLGATISGYEGITVGEKDFNGVLNKALAEKPDLIYFGGMYGEGGLIVKQAREKGIDVPIMGGDAIDSSTMIEIAGSAIENTYYTSVAADSSKTMEGQIFVDNYKKKFNKETESYSAYGYDSMLVILHALEALVKEDGDKVPTRAELTEKVRETSGFQGAITKVSFDEKGDNVESKVFIYKFEGQTYPGTQIGEVSQ